VPGAGTTYFWELHPKDNPCRIAAFNDGEQTAPVKLRLDKKFFAALGWSLADFARARAVHVTPEG